MILGEKLQLLRKKQGLSQEALAEKLTVSRQAISKWELGESVPDTENLVRLSKLFRVSADYLLCDEYESDDDIPAVRVNAENLRSDYSRARNRSLKKTSLILVSMGLLGLLIFGILSSVVVANKTVNDPHGSVAVAVDSATGEEVARPALPLYKTIEVTGDLPAFLSTYHLEWLFVLCILAVVVGGVGLLVVRKRTRAAIQ
jgi:transcriptional regulator with XRE-family HTH domain